MPKSHFYHKNIHLALDPMNGEILAIRNLITGDNLIKNGMCLNPETYVYQPFTFKLRKGDETIEYHPLYSREPLDHPEKKVQISSSKTEAGLLVRVDYHVVTGQPAMKGGSAAYMGDSTQELQMDLYYTVLITDNGLRFELHIQNTTDRVLSEVRFPVIGGVFLGDDHRDNVLVYPRTAGFKHEDPIGYFSREPNITHWRWNEYRYTYTDGMYAGDPLVASRGMRGYGMVYPGLLSMSWMDLYNHDGGVYYGVHTPPGEAVALECATYGRVCIGLNLASNFPVHVAAGEGYTTPPTVVEFHSGDWHEGAKIYRNFRYPLVQRPLSIIPSWAKTSVGVTAHYDFKIQDGTYIHTFRDLPQLARDSLAMGVDHMLLSGWNQDGFDNGYPLYYPDSELGTEEEFIEGIRQAKEMGVHVTLYENCQLYNLRYDKGDVSRRAVWDENGKMETQSWGINTLAVMCAMDRAWQDEIVENVKRATQKYGVDGIYFDQFCGYRRCFNPHHAHTDSDWGTARLKTVLRCQEDYHAAFGDAMVTMGEWVCDAYGGIMTYQLTQSFSTSQMGFCTDIFRYTFPEFGLVDMVYPDNVLMRPPQFGARETIAATCFTNGSYLWLYHIGDDINYFRDIRSMQRIQKINQLNTIVKQNFPDFEYVDTVGITCDEKIARVRRFHKGKHVLLKTYRYRDEDVTVSLAETIKKAFLLTADGKKHRLRVRKNTLRLPAEKVGLILLEIK